MKKSSQIVDCLEKCVTYGGEYWKCLYKVAERAIEFHKLPEVLANAIRSRVENEDKEVVEILAPFLLTDQENYENPTLCLIQSGLIYELMLKTSKIHHKSRALEPLVECLCRRLAAEENGASLFSDESENREEVEMSTEIEHQENEEEESVPNQEVGNALPKPDASLDYQSHLQDRDRVREMINKSAKRKESLVKMLSEAKIKDDSDEEPATPLVSAATLDGRDLADIKTPAMTTRVTRLTSEPVDEYYYPTPTGKEVNSLDFNEKNEAKNDLLNLEQSMASESPSVLKSLQVNTVDDSPYAYLFNSREEVIPPADIEIKPIGDNFESPQSSMDSEESPNIFNWEDVAMEKVASFQDRQPLRCRIFR